MHNDSFVASALGAPSPTDRTTLAALRAAARGTGLLLSGTTVLYRTDDSDRQLCQAVVARLPYPAGHPIRYGAEADLDECFTGTEAWWDSTRATLAEVAEARALRMAFPELRGEFTENEPSPAAEAPVEPAAATGRVA